MKTKFKMLIFLFIVEIGLAMVYVSPVALNFVSNSQEYYESGGIIRYNFFIDAVISQDGTEAKWCEDKFIDMKVEEWGINYFSGGYRPQNDFGNWYLKSIDMTFNGKPLVMKIIVIFKPFAFVPHTFINAYSFACMKAKTPV